MKYILKHLKTGEETICNKIQIENFDYYVSDEHAVANNFALYGGHITKKIVDTEWTTGDKKVIATTNPNIDIPKVVDEVERLAHKDNPLQKLDGEFLRASFKRGYNKAKEKYSFSDEDADAYADAVMSGCLLRAKEWKEQQPIKIYYVD